MERERDLWRCFPALNPILAMNHIQIQLFLLAEKWGSNLLGKWIEEFIFHQFFFSFPLAQHSSLPNNTWKNYFPASPVESFFSCSSHSVCVLYGFSLRVKLFFLLKTSNASWYSNGNKQQCVLLKLKTWSCTKEASGHKENSGKTAEGQSGKSEIIISEWKRENFICVC